MKMIFVTAHYRTQGEYGGQRSRFQYEAAAKASLLATVLRPSTDSLSGRKCKPTDVKDIISLPTNQFFYFGRRIFLLRFISQVAFTFFAAVYLVHNGKGAVVVLNNNPMITYFIIGLFLKMTNIPFVLDQRDVPFDKIGERSPFIGRFLWKLHKNISAGRLGSLSVTAGIRDRLIGLTTMSSDQVVELGMDGDYSNESIGADFVPSHATLVYVGSLNSYFSLEAICNDLNNCGFKGRLDYYGASNVEVLSKYKFFRHMGSVAKGELFERLQHYDAGLFPLQNLNFSYYLMGNKIFDYLNAGLPVCYFCEGRYETLSVETALKEFGLGFRYHECDWASSKTFSIGASGEDVTRYNRTVIDGKLVAFFVAIKNSSRGNSP